MSQAVAIGLLVVLFCGSQAQATTFIDEDFESGTLRSSGWSTDSCQYMGYTAPFPADGCNPTRSTDVAHSGTHSLKGDYTVPLFADGGTGSRGVWIYRTMPPHANRWHRFWYYTAPGFVYEGSTKHVYDNVTGSSMYPDGVLNHMWGGRDFWYVLQGIASQTCPSGSVGESCNFPPNLATVPIDDGRWYCVETHLNMGTEGRSDGLVEVFVDGVQTLGYYNRPFRPAGNTTLYNAVKLYIQGGGTGLMYYDDFALGDTRIGCTASPGSVTKGAPGPDTVSPMAPLGLTVR